MPHFPIQSKYFNYKGEASNSDESSAQHLVNKGRDDSIEPVEIASDQKVVRIDPQAFQAALDKLKDFSEVMVDNLPQNLRTQFGEVVQTLYQTKNKADIYNALVARVNETFKNVSRITPGTVASFFLGCNGGGFNGPQGCDPRCAASFETKTTENVPRCEDAVVALTNSGLKLLNNVVSKHAYVYIPSISFEGFDETEYNQLQKNYEHVTLIFESENGKSYKESQHRIATTALPRRVVAAGPAAAPLPQQSNTTNNTAAIVITVIIIVILILLIIFLLGRMYKQW